MNEPFLLLGVCCEYCVKRDDVGMRSAECPVKSAEPWTRWGSWCNSYEADPAIPEALTLEQAIKESIDAERKQRERP